ncbi:hypothetical protein [Finegoldia magna]|uniref:hypothetical protein n=1 Tax=Finegoldia magna TaxID=1260 RepID=UPI0029087502|nr:hypothetical protein [Finegoldia magna]MDU4731729.1 hypothetical protein [Finegoldia magna]
MSLKILPQIIESWGLNIKTEEVPKKARLTERPTTTPLFLLRAVELGLSGSDLSLLTI